MSSEPSLSLVIPNFDGEGHLPALLDSVARLDYPIHRRETIVVDNASNDRSIALVRERYPWVRVLPQTTNLGFAAGVNVGAGEASGDLLVLLNNDMRLDPAWLRELVDSYDPASGYRCIAGAVLDWEGRHIDFVGGYLTFHGMAFQEGFGLPVADVEIVDGLELPFASGGSMLIERRLFLELGGFDSDFFAFYEDADLGWRLRLAGHRTRLAGRAVSFHRHHGSSSSFTPADFARLYERNALLSVLKNVGQENLSRVLSATLALLVQRTIIDLRVDRASPVALARLRGAREVAELLPRVLERRDRVQSLRAAADLEVFAGFGQPFFPVVDHPAYHAALLRVIRRFALDELFPDAELPIRRGWRSRLRHARGAR